jgi:adenine-specific DNA methylase
MKGTGIHKNLIFKVMKSQEIKPENAKGSVAYYCMGLTGQMPYEDFVEKVKAIEDKETKAIVIKLFQAAKLQLNKANTLEMSLLMASHFAWSFNSKRMKDFPRNEDEAKDAKDFMDFPWDLND